MEKVAPLTILNVAFPLLTVGPDSGGGAEQILHLIDKGLVQAGMRSIVVGARGSEVGGRLIPMPVAFGEITDLVRKEAERAHALAIKAVLATEKVDLVHYHGLDFLEYQATNLGAPRLATLHLPVEWYPSSIFSQPGLTLNCVSHTQAASTLKWRALAVVPNGIAVHEFKVAHTKQDYLLWLGRICPEKGVHVALRVAHDLDLALFVAGPVHAFAAHEVYFEKQVRPLLDDKRRYLGPVGLSRKAELLANARCLLIPSSVAETSSLVAMEAISSGTPAEKKWLRLSRKQVRSHPPPAEGLRKAASVRTEW